jgi:hypothetical protein
MKQRKQFYTFSCAIISFTVLSGCLHSLGPPEPSPDSLEQAVRGALVAYAHGLAESFQETGAQLQSQTLHSAEEANERLQTGNAAARQQAFQPLDQMLNDELGGERWDADRAGQMFQRISAALRNFP